MSYIEKFKRHVRLAESASNAKVVRNERANRQCIENHVQAASNIARSALNDEEFWAWAETARGDKWFTRFYALERKVLGI